MTGLASAPRLSKGAIVSVDALTSKSTVIPFQYNPDGVTRSLQPSMGAPAAQGGRAEPSRFFGAPVESIEVTLRLDATDDLERGVAPGVVSGVSPRLSALEMTLYPSSASIVQRTSLAALGTIEILPPEAPYLLFAWGPDRVVPIRIESLQVTEKEHDPTLNPIYAEVQLKMRVLSYNDLPPTHKGHSIFLAYQIAKESLALQAPTASSIQSLRGGG